MARYRDLTVDELQAEIVEYRAALKGLALGEAVVTVWGERRRLDYVPPNAADARNELRELEAELARRPGFEDRRQWALGVEICR